MKLENLSSARKIARFLETQEMIVNQLLEEGKLGGVMVANLRLRGVPITPRLKYSVETVVRTLTAPATYRIGGPEAKTLLSEAAMTIMFTDMVNYSAMTERLGDRGARAVIKDHNKIIRRQTKANDGVEVKSMGDGFMLTFASARQAVACAVASQIDFAAYNKDHSETPLRIRMGMSLGEPIREEEDLFGKSVIVAARISAVANGAQILTCHLVREIVTRSDEFRFRSMGRFDLKGISAPQLLYEVTWR